MEECIGKVPLSLGHIAKEQAQSYGNKDSLNSFRKTGLFVRTSNEEEVGTSLPKASVFRWPERVHCNLDSKR